MKRIVIALSALAFVFGAGGALLQMPAHADEAKLEEAYKPPKDEAEINETIKEKKIARTSRHRKMKSKARKMRKGNHSRSGGRGATRCSSVYCR